jgi:nicotinamide-nucleotide amidase
MRELQQMSAAVAAALTERNENISVSESSTGGLISASLLSVPGASNYFLGGGVIYTHAARQALLGLGEQLPEGMRASTEAYARLCADTMLAKMGTTWAIAETGATGPTGNRYGDAAGHSVVAVSGPVAQTRIIETRSGDREANMWAFSRAALELLEHCINEA